MNETHKRYSKAKNYFRGRIKNIKLTKNWAEALIVSFAL